MSTINQALSELSENSHGATTKIEKAQIQKVKSRPVLPWVIGGFSLSLAIGGWAVSQQSEIIEQSVLISEPAFIEVDRQTHSASTSNSTESIEIGAIEKGSSGQVTIYQASNEISESSKVPVNQPKPMEKTAQSTATAQITKPQAEIKYEALPKVTETKTVKEKAPDTTLLLASNTQSKSKVNSQTLASTDSSLTSKPTNNTMTIEQVELTPAQLAEKAELQARKAIDSNNVDEALSSYKEALRYTPKDENIRQQLAALYYGKGDPRQAFEILQDGIKIDNDSEVIRIALAKLLIKEQQHEAALTPLMHLNHAPSIDYLSLRAALAQKNNLDDVALETYQQLVVIDDSNARWWLGLAIQQERNADMPKATEAYEQALTRVGLSRQSQIFVRERIKLLSTLEKSTNGEESSSAN